MVGTFLVTLSLARMSWVEGLVVCLEVWRLGRVEDGDGRELTEDFREVAKEGREDSELEEDETVFREEGRVV